MKISLLIGAIWVATGASLAVAEVATAVCPNLTILGEEALSFTPTETRLLCGDLTTPGWKSIPKDQMLFFLTAFFQERGYYKFKTSEKAGGLTIHLEPSARVNEIVFSGSPLADFLNEQRGLVGSTLTPKFLDTLEARVTFALHLAGYACPAVAVSANPETGIVTVTVTAGALLPVTGVEIEGTTDISEAADARYSFLRRFDAFVMNRPYNHLGVLLTAQRINRDGILQSAYFDTQCQEKGVFLRERIIAGPPRAIGVGFGIDTEDLLRARAYWRHLRLGHSASQIDTMLTASPRVQEFTAGSAWYFQGKFHRFHLQPRITWKHEKRTTLRSDSFERTDESVEGKASLLPATSWDGESVGLTASLGPTLNWSRVLQPASEAIRDYAYLALSGDIRVRSHDYEYYYLSPRSGFELGLRLEMARRGLFSNVSATYARARFEHLWNFMGYEPPFLVLGVRSVLGVTQTDEDGPSQLPFVYRQFLGGPSDLRGFGVKEIAGSDGVGGLAAAYVGWDARFPSLLPWGLQPFLFADAGMLGPRVLHFDEVVYFSPGFGIRWESPIGIIKASLGHSYLVGNTDKFTPVRRDALSHWKFYLSLGDEI